MAGSLRLPLLSLGITAILLCFLFTRSAAAADTDPDLAEEIHGVNHASAACNGERSDKGDQCREEPDDFDDDDFDDTYKVVNNVAVRLSASGGVLHWMEKVENTPSSEGELGNMFLEGH